MAHSNTDAFTPTLDQRAQQRQSGYKNSRKPARAPLVIHLSRKIKITYRFDLIKRASVLLARLLAVAGIGLTQFGMVYAQTVNVLSTALPTGGKVVGGSATVNTSGSAMTVNQATDRAALNWSTFNIGTGASVQFVQPSASSVALNRVQSTSGSVIQGKLSANGQVFLLNPNGVLFSKTARVDLGGLVASTMDADPAAFMAGGAVRLSGSGAAGARVVNQGDISTRGYAVLLGQDVSNQGTISAQAGSVVLAAGSAATLTLGGDKLIQFAVDPAALQVAVDNAGRIITDGGTVLLSAHSAAALTAGVVNNTGIVQARGMSQQDGFIRLEGGNVQLAGSIDASAGAGKAGKVEVNATSGVWSNANISVANNDQLTLTSASNSAKNAGSVTINAPFQYHSGSIDASSVQGAGGSINLQASQSQLHASSAAFNASGATGGAITVNGGQSIIASGSYQANGAAGAGGSVTLGAQDTMLAAANLSANGATGGGTVQVGGGWQGSAAAGIELAKTTWVNAATTISADAGQAAGQVGNGGKVVVWSNDTTTFAGSVSARGGAAGGNGGQIEVSGKQDLIYAAAKADASAAAGMGGANGTLLLDPKNITIVDTSAASGLNALELVNPLARTYTTYGGNTNISATSLPVNGNVLVRDSAATVGSASYAGAVHLFSATSGALMASVTGSAAGDRVGQANSSFDRNYSNGNALISSGSWGGGYGAVTWINGSTGALSTGATGGAVSAANSVVGSASQRGVGSGRESGSTLVGQSNFLLTSTAGYGAVTWINGATGKLSDGSNGGVVSTANSLLGTGFSGVTTVGPTSGGGKESLGEVRTESALAIAETTSTPSTRNYGNALVRNSNWNGGYGAVTWINGATGQLNDGSTGGQMSAANSLVGSTSSDRVGSSALTLGNGNAVVQSSNWNAGQGAVSAGAVTWINGSTGLLNTGANGGQVSAANSLIGGAAYDSVSSFGMQSVGTGNANVLIKSGFWGNGGGDRGSKGAVTWMNGSTGRLSTGDTGGVVSSANSVVGSGFGDSVGNYTSINRVGTGNANVILVNARWGNGGQSYGAATWINGNTGQLSDGSYGGAVSAANSLLGSAPNESLGKDQNGNIYISGVSKFGGGNALVATTKFGGSNSNNALGAFTWINGNSGKLLDGSEGGVVSAANSLVGGSAGDALGSSGVVQVGTADNQTGNRSNLLIASSNWAGGYGAVTWINGGNGTLANGSLAIGAVSSANSLVGGLVTDRLGSDSITTLNVANNGANALVTSSGWAANGNYGAVTWIDGNTGRLSTGAGAHGAAVSAANSLVGANAGDIGYASYGYNRNIQTVSAGEGGGSNSYAIVFGAQANSGYGAATWINASTGKLSDGSYGGVIGAANSLLGTQTALINGRYVTSLNQGNAIIGANGGYGASTWINGNTGRLNTGASGGSISAANSLLGSSTYDLGQSSVNNLSQGNAIVTNGGGSTGYGAATWINGSTGMLSDGSYGGIISAANSLVGATSSDYVSNRGVTQLNNGNALVSSDNNGYGAVTWINGSNGQLANGSAGGVLSAANSLVGSNSNDQVGNRITTLNGANSSNAIVTSSNWNNSYGAATWINGSNGQLSDGSYGGQITQANSLVGGASGDRVGSDQYSNSTVSALNQGNAVVISSSYGGGIGALTWINGATGRLVTGDTGGQVSSSNSQVGASNRDQLGNTDNSFYGQQVYLGNGDDFIYHSKQASGGYGALTWINGATGKLADGSIAGVISSANSWTDVKTFVNDDYTSLPTINVPGKLGVVFKTSDNRVFIARPNSITPGTLYANDPSESITMQASGIAATLNGGTNVVLQANTDITVNAAINANAASTGALTMQAGRSIAINANINTGNGNFTAIANDTAASGVVAAQRDAGAGGISMAGGTGISAGKGAVRLEVRDGAGVANAAAGDITTRSVNGGSVALVNLGGKITTAGKISTTNTSGDAIVVATAAAGKGWTNGYGGGVFNTAAGSRSLVYANGLAEVAKNGVTSDFRRYGTSYTGASTGLPAGNGFVYQYVPTLTVSANAGQGHQVGKAPQNGVTMVTANGDAEDTLASLGLTGVAVLSGRAGVLTSDEAAGTFNTTYNSGLSSSAGYRIVAGAPTSYTVRPSAASILLSNPAIFNPQFSIQLLIAQLTLWTGGYAFMGNRDDDDRKAPGTGSGLQTFVNQNASGTIDLSPRNKFQIQSDGIRMPAAN